MLVQLASLVKDDANFKKFVLQKVGYPLDRAEICKERLNSQFKAKNSAGFKKNDLKVSDFQELSKDLKQDQMQMSSQEFLK